MDRLDRDPYWREYLWQQYVRQQVPYKDLSMEAKTHYFLGSRLLGSSPLRPFDTDDRLAHSSRVFVCGTCGEAWGRVMIEGADWKPVKRACIKHPDYWDPQGGSFISTYRHTFDELPPEVLQHELSIRLDSYEKGKK